MYDDYTPGYEEAVKQGLVQTITVPPTPLIRLTSVEDAVTFTSGKDVSIIGFFPDQTTNTANAFLTVASNLSDNFDFSITSSPEIAANYEVEDEAVLLLKNFDSGRAILSEGIDEEAVEEFVRLSSNIQSYLLVFLSAQAKSYTQDVAVISNIEKEKEGKLLVFTFNKEDHKHVFEAFNITEIELPTFRAWQIEYGVKYKPEKDVIEAETKRSKKRI